MSSTDKPWYRQFWLLFVLAPLVVVVIASFATLIIAGAPPALVVDDFGAVALAIEQDRARDLRAAELGLRAEIRFLESGGTHRVQARLEGATPPTLHLQLVHPTRDSLDRRATLESAGGEYGAVFAPPATRMYVELTDPAGEWRLTGELPAGAQSLALTPRATAMP